MSEQIESEVLKAYADCWIGWDEGSKIRELDFRSGGQLTRDAAADLMSKAVPNGYNDFRADSIRSLPKTCRIEIAREGSVCLYVWNAGLAACRRLKADECDKQGDGSIRLWWD
jgi:hypothetical protein